MEMAVMRHTRHTPAARGVGITSPATVGRRWGDGFAKSRVIVSPLSQSASGRGDSHFWGAARGLHEGRMSHREASGSLGNEREGALSWRTPPYPMNRARLGGATY